jgi:rhodanese-related sulfurtransferase
VAIVDPHGPESLDITHAMSIPTGIRKDKNVTASALFGVAVIQMLRGAFGWLLYGGEYGLAEGFIIFNGGIFVALGIAARWVRVLAALSGAVNIDINAAGFAEKVAPFDKSQPILVNCHAGSRGAIASAALAKLGFKTICNLEGGLEAWEKDGHQPETQKQP